MVLDAVLVPQSSLCRTLAHLTKRPVVGLASSKLWIHRFTSRHDQGIKGSCSILVGHGAGIQCRLRPTTGRHDLKLRNVMLGRHEVPLAPST